MSYKQDVADVQQAIFDEDFYCQLYRRVLEDSGMTVENVTALKYQDDELSEMLNNFWWYLPDSPSIRRAPFFQLCDLCEGPEEEDD